MIALSTKLAEPVAHRAVADLIPCGHLRQRLLVNNDGAKYLIPTLHKSGGLKKELLVADSLGLHGEPPCSMSSNSSRKQPHSGDLTNGQPSLIPGQKPRKHG